MSVPNGNVIKQNLSFLEFYGKATYTVSDNFDFGGRFGVGWSVLNSGAYGIYYTGNVTLIAPSTWLTNGIGASLSADIGYWQLGTAAPSTPSRLFRRRPYPSYLTWDVGLTFAWKVFALDLRYYDTNLTKAQCNVFTSDQTAAFSRRQRDTAKPAVRPPAGAAPPLSPSCRSPPRSTQSNEDPTLLCAVAIGAGEIVVADHVVGTLAPHAGSPKWPSAQLTSSAGIAGRPSRWRPVGYLVARPL